MWGKLLEKHKHISKFFAGSSAGATAVMLTYPLDTIRARLAFQISGEHKYTGIVNAAVTIFKQVRTSLSYLMWYYFCLVLMSFLLCIYPTI